MYVNSKTNKCWPRCTNLAWNEVPLCQKPASFLFSWFEMSLMHPLLPINNLSKQLVQILRCSISSNLCFIHAALKWLHVNIKQCLEGLWVCVCADLLWDPSVQGVSSLCVLLRLGLSDCRISAKTHNIITVRTQSIGGKQRKWWIKKKALVCHFNLNNLHFAHFPAWLERNATEC